MMMQMIGSFAEFERATIRERTSAGIASAGAKGSHRRSMQEARHRFVDSREAALERLSGNIEPALIAVLSDINMPGMDGLQLSGEIKQRCPDLPVMMVTAYGDDERRRRAGELGAAQFLSKPVDSDLLKEQLRRLCSTEREQDRPIE
jgi:CheY-like chemotaxis protein